MVLSMAPLGPLLTQPLQYKPTPGLIQHMFYGRKNIVVSVNLHHIKQLLQ